MIFRDVIKIITKKNDFIDITDKISAIVESCSLSEGLCHVFVPGTTAGLILNENEPFLAEDLKRFYRKMADEKSLYNHPSNAFSHIRSLMTNKDKTIPISGSRLVLGEWQRLMLWEFDIRDRKRELIVTIIGEDLQ